MTYEIRSKIERGFRFDELRVWLARAKGDTFDVLEPVTEVWRNVPAGIEIEQPPSFVLPRDVAEHLLTALARQLRGLDVADALAELERARADARRWESRFDQVVGLVEDGGAGS